MNKKEGDRPIEAGKNRAAMKFLDTALEVGKCAYTVYGKRGKEEIMLYSRLNKTREEAIIDWNEDKELPVFKNASRAELCCKEKKLGISISCKDLK